MGKREFGAMDEAPGLGMSLWLWSNRVYVLWDGRTDGRGLKSYVQLRRHFGTKDDRDGGGWGIAYLLSLSLYAVSRDHEPGNSKASRLILHD